MGSAGGSRDSFRGAVPQAERERRGAIRAGGEAVYEAGAAGGQGSV